MKSIASQYLFLRTNAMHRQRLLKKGFARSIYHCGQSITACSMRLLFTFSPGHILRSECLQFIAYKDNTQAFNNMAAQLYKYCN